MLNLMEMSVKIVLEHQSEKEITSVALLNEIKQVYAELKALAVDSFEMSVPPPTPSVQPVQTTFTPRMSDRRASAIQKMITDNGLGNKEIKCLVCGRSMKVLKQHITKEHNLSPLEYKNQFGIPYSTPLVSTEYHELRRQNAIQRSFGHHHKKIESLVQASVQPKPKREGVYGAGESHRFSNNPKIIIRKKSASQ